MHFNQVFCSIWQNFSKQENFFSRLSSLCFLNFDFYLACVCFQVWHNAAAKLREATARWEAFFSQIFPSESPCHYVGTGQHLLLCIVLPSSAFSCLKAFRKSNSSMSLHLDYVLKVDLFDSLSTWRFLKFPFLLTSRLSRSGRQGQDWKSMMCLQGPLHHDWIPPPQF